MISVRDNKRTSQSTSAGCGKYVQHASVCPPSLPIPGVVNLSSFCSCCLPLVYPVDRQFSSAFVSTGNPFSSVAVGGSYRFKEPDRRNQIFGMGIYPWTTPEFLANNARPDTTPTLSHSTTPTPATTPSSSEQLRGSSQPFNNIIPASTSKSGSIQDHLPAAAALAGCFSGGAVGLHAPPHQRSRASCNPQPYYPQS